MPSYKWTPSAQRVTAGTPGTWRFKAATAQYVLDVAAMTAEAANVLDGTTILGVAGTYVLPWNAVADSAKDPLTKAYEILWQILESNPNFVAMVKPHNRIKYTDDAITGVSAPRYPERDSRQPQEYPQVKIEAVGGASDMYCSSDGTRIQERFQILVNTGDRRLCYTKDGIYQGLFPLQWTILRAMMSWETYLRPQTWNGKVFVHHCSVSNRQEKIDNPRLDEQKATVRDAGWSVVWQGDLELWFTSADMTA